MGKNYNSFSKIKEKKNIRKKEKTYLLSRLKKNSSQ